MDRGRGSEVWARRIAEWEQSDLTQTAYCQRHGLSKTMFWKWRQRLKTATTAPSGFVEVTPPTPPGRSPSICVTIEPSGAIHIDVSSRWAGGGR